MLPYRREKIIVCDNIVFELQSVGGVSKYWSETIKRLDNSLDALSFLEGPCVEQNIFRAELSLRSPVFPDRGWLLRRRLFSSRVQADVFHSSYYRISHQTKANIVTIHDFMNELFPTGPRDVLLARLKRRACRNAKMIVAVSERTRQDLLKHYPFVDPGRVKVIYNGVDGSFYPDPRKHPFGIDGRSLTPRGYFLYVGGRGYCKNFPLVLRFLAESRRQGLELPLITVGGGPLTESEWTFARELGIQESAIHQYYHLPTSELRVLYSNCMALLIPSIYEGFGLPAAEGARCGALVLSARGSALDEIVGETEFAFDLRREEEASRLLSLGLESQYGESERVRMQERSNKFNWDSSSERLIEVYNEI
ncbi:glycosyltransferase family 4 protein [Oceanomicrobium pacificus]|uniref:Glycosyltransferase n=1 Tax=Oceanomicrobium pacificus TaxID=2692916 RepID=A0A6B0TV55_9RHOB|nr:glycosyltransferase family 1 protein [Oceanomicrobium pacificus]MXU65014.1 glycosyltransferase [Oceanomicrobium pacificus]